MKFKILRKNNKNFQKNIFIGKKKLKIRKKYKYLFI
jgi:hypothetical protein